MYFPSVMEGTFVFTTIPETFEAFVHDGRGIRTGTDAVKHPYGFESHVPHEKTHTGSNE